MTESDAFEYLGNLIGRPLSINGVHGAQLRALAEKVVELKAEGESRLAAFQRVVKAMELGPETLLVLTVDADDRLPTVEELMFMKRSLGVKSVLSLPSDMEVGVFPPEEVGKVISHLFLNFPEAETAVRAEDRGRVSELETTLALLPGIDNPRSPQDVMEVLSQLEQHQTRADFFARQHALLDDTVKKQTDIIAALRQDVQNLMVDKKNAIDKLEATMREALTQLETVNVQGLEVNDTLKKVRALLGEEVRR